MITIKTAAEIEKMRVAGQVVAQVLAGMQRMVEPGITTGDLNAMAEEECSKRGAIPVFKNYPNFVTGRPFPGSICASVNEEVVHGIPGPRKLKEGDIISIDFGVLVDGYAGDSAVTIAVGKVEPRVAELLQVTEEALLKGIQEALPGRHLGAISHAVQTHVEKAGFSVVRDFVGHGIGRQMHEEPSVPNFGKPNRGPVLQAGMALAIEPMVNLGSYHVYTRMDEWTVATRDGKPSAHFEHTIVITDNGPEILTLR